MMKSELIWSVENRTDEFVQLMFVDDIIRSETVIPNLRFLIPLSLDNSGIIFPIHFYDMT